MINNQEQLKIAERILNEWDSALEQLDMDKLITLYSADAIIESPLISYLLNRESGVCKGIKNVYDHEVVTR